MYTFVKLQISLIKIAWPWSNFIDCQQPVFVLIVGSFLVWVHFEKLCCTNNTTHEFYTITLPTKNIISELGNLLFASFQSISFFGLPTLLVKLVDPV
jgi:hypothetical protein